MKFGGGSREHGRDGTQFKWLLKVQKLFVEVPEAERVTSEYTTHFEK